MTREQHFEDLVAKAGPRVFGLILRYVRARPLAEDLWQDVLWSAWRAGDTLERDRDPLPWLRTLAVNRVIDHVRRQAVRVAPKGDAGLADHADVSADQRFEFEDELAVLPLHERAALLLHYQEARSVTDIATLIGVPPGTVKSWLFRGRARLRARLAADGALRSTLPEDRR